MTTGDGARSSTFGRPARDVRNSRVMVIDPDADTALAVQSLVAAHSLEGFVVSSIDIALQLFAEERPAGVILDLTTIGVTQGLHTLDALARIDAEVPVIVLSAHDLDVPASQLLAHGARACIDKPLVAGEFESRLLKALSFQRTFENTAARGQLQTDARYPLLLGEGQVMADIAALIRRVADTDVTILIRGESGTGKEVVARAIAASSARRDKPFVKVNCAAIPSELLESELFGYERGAFTNAVQQKPGKFEFANHGTMFLDEIGDIGLGMQAKLLHVLQDGEFSRLGGNRELRVDVRLIAATNRDLETAVAQGLFRADLFFRLNVIAITLPPLRDRPADVPLLIDHFLRKYSSQYRRPLVRLSAEAERRFCEYAWPGNIRELEHAIKQVVILGTDAPVTRELAAQIEAAAVRDTVATDRDSVVRTTLTPDQLPLPVAEEQRHLAGLGGARATSSEMTGRGGPASTVAPARTESIPAPPPEPPLVSGAYSLKDVAREAARNAERELILQVLQRTRWNRKAAAAILSISYKALLYKIKENGLDLARQV